METSTWKHRGFFGLRSYTEKGTWKQRGFFGHQNYIEKSTWKQRGFSTIKITSTKVRGNDVKFVEIWSSAYRRNIDVESTST